MSYDPTADASSKEVSKDTSAAPSPSPSPIPKPSVFKRLGDLFVSAGNVRKTGKPVKIPVLAALIKAQGLMNPLHISVELDASGKPTGRFGVEAGGRRYRALMLLVEQGHGSLDDLIECKEVAASNATAVSLAENFGQERMHPADEYTAFKDLFDQGRTIVAIAEEHGETVAHVKRRLRLANVAPALFDIYRNGDMTLEQVMALASTDDQERQLETWKSLSAYERHPSTLKRKLKEFTVPMNDPRVKLIGFKNYTAMGGATETDLFTQGEPKTLTDIVLVELMVGAVIDTEVQAVESEGWAWVARFGDFGNDERRLYEQLPKQYKDETPKQVTERKALEMKQSELEEKLEALEEDDDATWAQMQPVQTEIDAVEKQLMALKELRVCTDALDKTQCGAVVAFEGEAGIVVYRGMVERKGKGAGTNTSGSGEYVKPKAEKAEFSEKLMMNLSGHRTAAIQASMLTNHAVSLASLATTFALGIFELYSMDSPLKISLRQCRDDMTRNSDTLDASRAAVQIDEATAKWKALLPKDSGVWLAWFIEQPQSVVLEFIVYASAVSTNAITGFVREDQPSDQLAKALNLDMTQWWRANPESFFDLVPKSKLAAIVREVGTEAEAAALEKMKKPEAVAAVVAVTEYKDWLPMPLRNTPLAVELTPEEDVDSEPADNVEN